jgi:hypothetical protein
MAAATVQALCGDGKESPRQGSPDCFAFAHSGTILRFKRIDRWCKPGSKADGGGGRWIIRDGLSQEVHRKRSPSDATTSRQN